MRLHTRDQAPKEGQKEAPEQPAEQPLRQVQPLCSFSISAQQLSNCCSRSQKKTSNMLTQGLQDITYTGADMRHL